MKLPKIGKLTVLHRNHIGGSFFVLVRIYQRWGFFRLSLSSVCNCSCYCPQWDFSACLLPNPISLWYFFLSLSILVNILLNHFLSLWTLCHGRGIASCLDPQIITGWQIFLSLSALCDIFSCLHPAHLFRTFSCLWPNLYILQISFQFYDIQ